MICACEEERQERVKIEGRYFLRCQACKSLSPMPRHGARVLNPGPVQRAMQTDTGSGMGWAYGLIVGAGVWTLILMALGVL